jgi:hypothetical protein
MTITKMCPSCQADRVARLVAAGQRALLHAGMFDSDAHFDRWYDRGHDLLATATGLAILLSEHLDPATRHAAPQPTQVH